MRRELGGNTIHQGVGSIRVCGGHRRSFDWDEVHPVVVGAGAHVVVSSADERVAFEFGVIDVMVLSVEAPSNASNVRVQASEHF